MRRASPIPPPVWFLGSLGLMALLHLEAPGPEVVPAPWNLAGLVPMMGGCLLHLAAWRALRTADVCLDEIVPPPRLVTGGPFHHTRNPMYTAGVMILVGFAVFLGTAGGAMGALVFPWVAGTRFVKAEEAVLEDRFGEEYRAYRRRVGRWLWDGRRTDRTPAGRRADRGPPWYRPCGPERGGEVPRSGEQGGRPEG